MLRVKVYSLENGQEVVREIIWNGKELVPSDKSSVLKRILKTSIYVPLKSGVDGKIDPKKDPQEFIRRLCWQYKSYILRVSKPEIL